MFSTAATGTRQTGAWHRNPLLTVQNGGAFSTSWEIFPSEGRVGEPREESCSILHSLKGQLDSFTLYPGGGGIWLIFPFHWTAHRKLSHYTWRLLLPPVFLNHRMRCKTSRKGCLLLLSFGGGAYAQYTYTWVPQDKQWQDDSVIWIVLISLLKKKKKSNKKTEELEHDCFIFVRLCVILCSMWIAIIRLLFKYIYRSNY